MLDSTCAVKPCRTCERELPLGSFHRKASSPGGLNLDCRNCVSAYKRALRESKRESGTDLGGTKTCRRCQRTLPLNDFDRNLEGAGGRVAKCRACRAEEQRDWYATHPEKVAVINAARRTPEGRAAAAAWRAKNAERIKEYGERSRRRNPGQRRNAYYLAKYGITAARYDVLFATQGGVCAICAEPPRERGRGGSIKAMAVDHCHVSAAVRGLLCSACNQGLGHFGDDPRLLQAAIRYLTEHKERAS